VTCVRTASVCRRHGARRSCGDAERREGLAAGACKATGGAQPQGVRACGDGIAMARGAIASTQLTLCSLRHRREAQFPTVPHRDSANRRGTLPDPTRAPTRPVDPTGSGFRPAPGFALPPAPLSAVARVRGTPQSPRPAADPREPATPDGRNLRERAKLNGGRSVRGCGMCLLTNLICNFYEARGRDRAVLGRSV